MTRGISPDIQHLIKTHALGCFNYLQRDHGNNTATNARKIFLQRILFEPIINKEALQREVRDYLKGSGVYSQSCFGTSFGRGKDLRVAYAYNLGLFNGLLGTANTRQFETLTKKERKRVVSACCKFT
jgi:hypothetical protein